VKVAFDTNVVLDVLMGRQPHFEIGVELFDQLDRRQFQGTICATTVTTVHYVAGRTLTAGRARKLIGDLLDLFSIARVDEGVLRRALALRFSDFEDAVLHEAAEASGAAAIVTRDARGFARASLPVYTPLELLASLESAETPGGDPRGTLRRL
jgi:predicted nucleic acid-binding protein